MCLYICTGRKLGMARVWTKQADRQMNMPKNVTKREEGKVENKEGQEEEKTERARMVEKVERDGAPDLTTLTHLGLSLLASCALWSTERGHTRTHIYLSTHAGDEDILGLCECVCMCM